jgi:hypothetical protein
MHAEDAAFKMEAVISVITSQISVVVSIVEGDPHINEAKKLH